MSASDMASSADAGAAANLNGQAARLLADVETGGDPAALNHAIALLRQAVAATPAGHPDLAHYLSHLGLALQVRFGRTGDPADLAEQVQVERQSVAAATAGHPRRAVYLWSLSLALQSRFGQSGELADLTEAVQVSRQAVADAADGDPYLANYLNTLGLALATRFGRTGELADLTAAVEARRRAVAALPTGHPSRVGYLSNLGRALRNRFGHTAKLADLTEAVEVGHQVVAAVPVDDPDLAGHLADLGYTLRTSFDNTGDLAAINRAVAVGRQVVAAVPAEDSQRAGHLSDLGLALYARFGHTGELVDLTEAMELTRQALAACPPDDPDWAGLMSDLGLAYRIRFERTGELADLRDAVELSRTAMVATSIDHPDRAIRLTNLGTVLFTRFVRVGELADLVEAVTVSRQAVAATAAGDLRRPTMLSNLGIYLRLRFQTTGEVADIVEAVSVGRQAVRTSPAGHPDRAMYLSNLGLLLLTRAERRVIGVDKVTALRAMYCFRKGAWTVSAPPAMRASCGRLWATLAAQLRSWLEARQAHRLVLGLLPQLVDHGLSPGDRRHHLSQLQSLGADAAHAQLARPRGLAWWRRAHRAGQAWSALELGRGVLIGQALEARSDTTTLRLAHPELADQIEDLRGELGQETPIGPAGHHEVADRWRALLTKVRATPGFAEFGLPPTVAQLHAAAGAGTIVAVNVSPHGCHALLLDAHRARFLRLPRLTEKDATDRARQLGAAVNPPEGHPADPKAIAAVLAWLWDGVAAPVLDHLGFRRTPGQDDPWPRIWWIPTGALSALPIHAAGHHDDPPGPTRRAVLDRVVSSYTPTARALLAARSRGAPGREALVVGVNDAPELPHLRHAEPEAATVHQLLHGDTAPLLGAAATTAAVRARLPQVSWAHFACHARAEQQDPADSHLALHDGRLTVRELGTMELPHAYLAYLSACTTATGADRLLDESIHVASAFQLAGFPHVIATLWAIPDYVAPDFAAAIYAAVTNGTPPALAVHDTVRARRDAHHGRRPQVWATHVHFGP